MAPDDQTPENPEKKQNLENPELDEFFQRLPANFHWPKPTDAAVAAAMETIQRIVGIAGAELTSDRIAEPGDCCSRCGATLEAGVHFCPQCGLAAGSPVGESAQVRQSSSAAVHHHHHYHHFVPAQAGKPSPPASEPESPAARGRAPGTPGLPTGGRAEVLARQVAQDWAQACNTKHLDDLLELYAADATLIRSNVPPVRSLPAVREFLHALIEAGLGDLEMESLRVEVMGEIAMDLGRCKMLVPVAMGKRREDRGKYLLVLVRQPAGTWKILADCWSSDQSVTASQPPEPSRKAAEISPPARKPR